MTQQAYSQTRGALASTTVFCLVSTLGSTASLCPHHSKSPAARRFLRHCARNRSKTAAPALRPRLNRNDPNLQVSPRSIVAGMVCVRTGGSASTPGCVKSCPLGPLKDRRGVTHSVSRRNLSVCMRTPWAGSGRARSARGSSGAGRALCAVGAEASRDGVRSAFCALDHAEGIAALSGCARRASSLSTY